MDKLVAGMLVIGLLLIFSLIMFLYAFSPIWINSCLEGGGKVIVGKVGLFKACVLG